MRWRSVLCTCFEEVHGHFCEPPVNKAGVELKADGEEKGMNTSA